MSFSPPSTPVQSSLTSPVTTNLTELSTIRDDRSHQVKHTSHGDDSNHNPSLVPISGTPTLTFDEKSILIWSTTAGAIISTISALLFSQRRTLLQQAQYLSTLPTLTIKEAITLLAPNRPTHSSTTTSTHSTNIDTGLTTITCVVQGFSAAPYDEMTQTHDGRQPAVMTMVNTTEFYETTAVIAFPGASDSAFVAGPAGTYTRQGSPINHGADVLKVIDVTDTKYLDDYLNTFKRTRDPVFNKMGSKKNKKGSKQHQPTSTQSHPNLLTPAQSVLPPHNNCSQIVLGPDQPAAGSEEGDLDQDDGVDIDEESDDDGNDADDFELPSFPTAHLTLPRSLIPQELWKSHERTTQMSSSLNIGFGAFFGWPSFGSGRTEQEEKYVPLKAAVSVAGDIFYDSNDLTLKVGNMTQKDVGVFAPVVSTGDKDSMVEALRTDATFLTVAASLVGTFGLWCMVAPGLRFMMGEKGW